MFSFYINNRLRSRNFNSSKRFDIGRNYFASAGSSNGVTYADLNNVNDPMHHWNNSTRNSARNPKFLVNRLAVDQIYTIRQWINGKDVISSQNGQLLGTVEIVDSGASAVNACSLSAPTTAEISTRLCLISWSKNARVDTAMIAQLPWATAKRFGVCSLTDPDIDGIVYTRHGGRSSGITS